MRWVDIPDGIILANKDDKTKVTHVFSKPFVS